MNDHNANNSLLYALCLEVLKGRSWSPWGGSMPINHCHLPFDLCADVCVPFPFPRHSESCPEFISGLFQNLNDSRLISWNFLKPWNIPRKKMSAPLENDVILSAHPVILGAYLVILSPPRFLADEGSQVTEIPIRLRSGQAYFTEFIPS